MVHGPCGGVDAGGGCEVDDRRCVLVDGPLVPFDGEPGRSALNPRAQRLADLMADRPIVVADFPARALDVASTVGCADILTGAVDVVLAGDAPSARVQFSPTLRVGLVQDRGLPVWIGLNCRDRNRVALEAELASLAVGDVAGVHCVTGDHPAVGHRTDAAAVFDLDSTDLAALAARYGHLVSVGESPAAPPRLLRAARAVEKQKAGAAVVFVNHCGPASAVREFVGQFREAGGTAAVIACVPVVLDHGSAALLRTFPGLVLPDGYLDAVLEATDPERSGIDATVALAETMLALDGISGVNLSGGPADGAEEAFAAAMATIGQRLRAR